MSKLVTRRRRDNRKPPRSPYERLSGSEGEEHPIDLAVEARVRHEALRRRIQRLQAYVLEALGDDMKAMLDLEALRNDERLERETAYFDLGYQHGFAADRKSV